MNRLSRCLPIAANAKVNVFCPPFGRLQPAVVRDRMVVIERKKFGISVTEVYFAQQPLTPQSPADVVMYIRCASPARGLSEARTLLVDLGRDEEGLLAACSRTTRKNVRRSARGDLHVDFVASPNQEALDAFFGFYDEFARQKKRPPVNRAKVASLHRASALALSVVRDDTGAPLVYHTYVIDSEIGRAMQLYSASHFREHDDSGQRNMLARAHRYLCWMNIISFKDLGYRIYDFGGLPPADETDQELTQIAYFKQGFGGTETIEYSGQQGLTLLGKLACFLKR